MYKLATVFFPKNEHFCNFFAQSFLQTFIANEVLNEASRTSFLVFIDQFFVTNFRTWICLNRSKLRGKSERKEKQR